MTTETLKPEDLANFASDDARLIVELLTDCNGHAAGTFVRARRRQLKQAGLVKGVDYAPNGTYAPGTDTPKPDRFPLLFGSWDCEATKAQSHEGTKLPGASDRAMKPKDIEKH